MKKVALIRILSRVFAETILQIETEVSNSIDSFEISIEIDDEGKVKVSKTIEDSKG